jgi:Leucine-rich repeat (LRR) protein
MILCVSDENNLTGTIPDEFGQLSMLTKIDLSFNENLLGFIPETISLLTNLETFRIQSANFTGPIPVGIGSATSLVEFQADGNSLEGNIPPSIGRLTELQSLFLPRNSFNGSLPSELGLLTNLELLFVNDNTLTGSIPSTMEALTALRQADLSFNQFVDGADSLCNIESSSLVKFEADCFEQLVPAIAQEIST